MNPKSMSNRRLHRVAPPKPLNAFRKWLADTNYPLVQWVRAGIIHRYPDLCHDDLLWHLEDAYLAACRLYSLDKRQANGRRICFSTYAIASMRLSGFRDWMRDLKSVGEATRRSIDYRDESVEHDPLILDCLAREDDPSLPVLEEELLELLQKRLTKRQLRIIKWRAKGLNNADIGEKLHMSRERVRQVLLIVREMLTEEQGVAS
jgi:hypothetical protein